jgi:hypothetical protein
MTNENGKPIYDLLRKNGLPVQGVVVLGAFVHVDCLCSDTARKVANVMQPGGFNYLKTTKHVEKAKHANEAKSVRGMTTWVERHTAHFKVRDNV